MATAFTRQLGAEAGVQLNPLRDNSEIPTADNYDQLFAIMCRLTRGRIDRPFKVNRGNYQAKIGKGEPLRKSELNEAWVQIVEALNNGAYEAVVQRLVTGTAVIRYAVCFFSEDFFWDTRDDISDSSYFLAIKHLECFNDGIQCEFHAEEKRVNGIVIDNDKINLRVKDANGVVLFNFVGSLDPNSVDDYQNSNYLPDVVASQTDAIEVYVGVDTSIPVPSSAYGYDANGLANWSQSDTLICFDEGDTGYSTQDYATARTLLQTTPFNYGYISAGGSQSAALISQLMQLAYDTNKPLAFDIPGRLSKEAAIAFYEQLNVGGNFNSSHLVWAYWAPLKTQDPTGINGKCFLGTATLLIAYACARNAVKNAKGYARKNYPIAGRDFPLNRPAILIMVLRLA